MMKSIIALVAFVALAFAQINPQTGPLTVTTLVSGPTVQPFSLPITTEADGFHLNLYKLWVPENSTGVYIVFNNTYPDTDFDCEDLRIYASLNGYVPCSYEEYPEENFLCANGFTDYADNDDEPVLGAFTPSTYDNDGSTFTGWAVNQWWYFGVGRDDQSDYASACTYTVQVVVNSTCPQGTIGQSEDLDSDETVCSPAYVYKNTSASTTYTLTGSTSAVYEVQIPTSTVGHVYINVTSQLEDLFIYGTSYSSPLYEYNACEIEDGEEIGNTGVYTYSLFCYTPRVGSFFVTVYNDDEGENPTLSGTISITYVECNSTFTGMGGYNCSFPVVACNNSWSNYGVYLAYPESADDSYLSGPAWYCYLDVPANYSKASYDLTVTIPGTGNDDYDYYVIVRKNGFSESDIDYGYEGDDAGKTELEQGDTYTLGLTAFDFYEPGRFFIGLFCEQDGDGTNGCNFTLSSNTTNGPMTTTTSGSTVSSTTSTKGTSSTASSTTSTKGTTSTMNSMVMTTHASGKTSSSAVILPTLFVVVASMVALLF